VPICRASSVFACALPFLSLAAVSSAAPAPSPRIVSSRAVSATERLLRIQGVPAHTAHGPVFTLPPPPPPAHSREQEEEQPPAPIRDDRLAIAPRQRAETGGTGGPLDKLGNSTAVFRDSALTPPSTYSSSVNEPNVGGQGDALFTTHNWYAEISGDAGATYTYISPYSTFPAAPSEFSGGFCCDQRVAQDSSRGLVFWYLQYSLNGASPISNGVRLAVAHGAGDLAANTWRYYDFTPAMFGLTDKWFDFPHLQASANFLYFTTNIFSGSTGNFYGALVVRMPLDQLAAGVSLTLDSFLVAGSYGSILAVSGAAAEGHRPGRTAMYFAAVYSTTSLKVLTWPEADALPAVHDVTGLATTSASVFSCLGPDSRDPCTRANPRAQTGWITDTELGVMWSSSQNGGTRPYPYTRVAVLDPVSLAVLAQPDIYSNSSAWLYPALAVNERGHLGGTISNLGGNVLPTLRYLIRDDLSIDPSIAGWETYAAAASDAGTSGRWGDYNGAAAHPRYPTTWLGAGHIQVGGGSNVNSQTHSIWFGRQRDLPQPPPSLGLDFYTVTPCRVLDTRVNGYALLSGMQQLFPVAGRCGIPADAAAVSLNVTVATPGSEGHVTLFPGDALPPATSTLNFRTGVTRANSAILPLAGNGIGALAARSFLLSGGRVDVIVDVNGYFR
jgi:hypothetical protein